ncbi:MAG: SDR family oxidoreductase [Alphaproteobacteria bacterium]|nr:SDR family oxidoreductase [Alphaproteobacteria bacterium]
MQAKSSPWLSIPVPRDGAHVRLICFPHGGGGPQAYRSWGESLPRWIEVVCVQPPGRGSRWREEAVRDIGVFRSSVADALGEITTAPYALFGHSVGALVAFEVARELERRGAPSPLRAFLSAYEAPDRPHNRQQPSLSKADDQALLAYLATLGHESTEALADEEFKSLMLESVRADFAVAETYRHEQAARIRSPITALGGDADCAIPIDGLAAWRQHTAGAFSQTSFPGGHFYTESARDDLLAHIADTLQADLDGLPQSLLFGTREVYPRDACLHELFRQQAAKTPKSVALIDPSNPTSRRLTFAELDSQSDLLAQRLVALGCAPGQRVALLMAPSAEFMVAYLAALKAGGAYLPIPSATPDAAVAEILETTNPVAVVTTGSRSIRLPQRWRCSDRCIEMDQGWEGRNATQQLARLDDGPAVAPADPAYVVMTSGTTGKPKGIVCPHRGAVNSYWWRYRHLPYADDEREACNVFFVWEVLRPLLRGKPAILIPDDVIFDPRRLIGFLESHRVSRVLFTPSLLDTVLSNAGGDLGRRLAALHTVILNGEVVTVALARRFANVLPHVRLVNDYSISECHDVATVDIDPKAMDRAAGRRYLPVGGPMGNVNIYVLDEASQPVPRGVPGEIHVGGDSIACGYLDAPARTAERFLPDPFATNTANHDEPARMFRTGDMGRILPGGEVEISGRAHFMVKLRGYTVVPAAIEAELRSFPDCAAAAVVAVDDEDTGQPDYLIAYVVTGGPAGELDRSAIRAHLKDRLPPYAIPRDFIELPVLPIDPATGKIDRRKLPRPPARAKVLTTAAPANAADPFADRLAALWRRVLGVEAVAADDNFFDLGGHSLLAADLTRAVVDELGIDADVIDVFDKPVFKAYAADLRSKGQPGRMLRPCAVASDQPLSQYGPADIAVIAMAGRFPGADTIDELWQLVCDGRSAIRRFTDDELRRRGVSEHLLRNPAYVKVGAILEDVASFDPRFWGLSEAEAIILDPQQRLFLECCWHALEASGHRPDDEDGNIGVFAGCYLPGYLIHHLGANDYLDAANPAKFHLTEIGNDKDYLASRVAYLMNLNGPAISIQTSCSTGLVAIAEAAAALRAGSCRMALAGASSITFPQGGFVSADGHIGTGSGACRAFDASADGTILGDGVGVVVLRRLEDALADGDNVLAVIKGHAVNNDGASKAGYSAPSPSGQAAVIRSALRHAGADPATVGYIEAHGTGTRLGDPIEVRGLNEAYGADRGNRGQCALGSIKPNIGHANIAAGTAGFIKAVLAVSHGVIPPLAGFERENPELHLADTPFYVPRERQPWRSSDGKPRRAGISSFGIGGTNCHVVIEEAPAAVSASTADDTAQVGTPHILPLSAKSGQDLVELARSLARFLRANPGLPLADIAATLQSGRMEFAHRLAVVADSHQAAAEAFEQRAASASPSFQGCDATTGSQIDRIANRWETGGDIDWRALREDPLMRRVALPGYPFARVRCWPEHDVALVRDNAEGSIAVRETRQPWRQMLYLPSWARTAPPVSGRQPWQGTYIFLSPADPQPGHVAGQIEDLLTHPNVRVVNVRTDAGQRGRKATIMDLLERVSTTQGAIRIVDFTGIGIAPRSLDDGVTATADLTALLLALSRQTSARTIEYWLLSSAILKVQDEPINPLLAPLVGPILAASQENPSLQARLIDLEPEGAGERMAAAVAEELQAVQPRAEPVLALRGRHRWVERFEPLDVADQNRERGMQRLLTAKGPHIITGGLGRIGIALARRLAVSGCDVVLMSRRNLEEAQSLVASQLGEFSERLSLIPCDVADSAALQAALFEIGNKAGGLGGVFHAAGVADLKYLHDTTRGSIAAECAPKIAGSRNLRRAIAALQAAGAPLPQFVLTFSSLASILGGLGMAGYAAANRYLDAEVAQAPEANGVPWMAVNFDDWEFEYGKEQVAAYSSTRKGLAIPPADGMAIIETLLGTPGLERVVVSATLLDQRVARWGRLPAIATIAGQDIEPRSVAAKQLHTSMAGKAPGDIFAIVLMAYAKVIGSRDLAPDSNFFDLGGDSLLAAQLAMELRTMVPDSDAGVGDVLDFPTPRHLAERLQGCLAGSGGQHGDRSDGGPICSWSA